MLLSFLTTYFNAQLTQGREKGTLLIRSVEHENSLTSMAFSNFKCQWNFQVPSKFSETEVHYRFFELTDSSVIPYGEDTKYSEKEKKSFNSDKLSGRFLPRSMTAEQTCFLFFLDLFTLVIQTFLYFFIASAINSQIDEPPSVIISQCSNIIFSIWTFFKHCSFQCGSVLFIKWHDSHRGLTVQAVPCTEFGSEETEYKAYLF